MKNLTITDAATTRLLSYKTEIDQFLRISVVTGGCSGMTYNAQIDTELHDQDVIVYEEDDIKIVSDARSSLFLDGLRIDYSNDLIQAGFRITNPNASASCACGASFGV